MKRFILFVLLSVAALQGTYGQRFKRTGETEKLPVVGFAQGPVLSPDGRLVAYSTEGYNRVRVLNLETHQTKEVCAHLGSGWGMRWIDNRRMLVRSTMDAPDPRQRKMGLELIDVETKLETPAIPLATQNRIEVPQRSATGKTLVRNRQTVSVLEFTPSASKVRMFQKAERDWTFEGDKIVTASRTYATPGERAILSLNWSPDGMKAIVETIGRPSLYLFERQTGRFQLLAEKGERASWGTNDAYIYMETDDDGHAIVNGDIFIGSIRDRKRENLTETFLKIALNPTLSSDGTIVFNTAEGELFLMKVQLGSY